MWIFIYSVYLLNAMECMCAVPTENSKQWSQNFYVCESNLIKAPNYSLSRLLKAPQVLNASPLDMYDLSSIVIDTITYNIIQKFFLIHFWILFHLDIMEWIVSLTIVDKFKGLFNFSVLTHLNSNSTISSWFFWRSVRYTFFKEPSENGKYKQPAGILPRYETILYVNPGHDLSLPSRQLSKCYWVTNILPSLYTTYDLRIYLCNDK